MQCVGSWGRSGVTGCGCHDFVHIRVAAEVPARRRQSIWRGGFDDDVFVPIRPRYGGGVSSTSQTTGGSA